MPNKKTSRIDAKIGRAVRPIYWPRRMARPETVLPQAMPDAAAKEVRGPLLGPRSRGPRHLSVSAFDSLQRRTASRCRRRAWRLDRTIVLLAAARLSHIASGAADVALTIVACGLPISTMLTQLLL